MFYYGDPHIAVTGACHHCECHNNSDTCDMVTGACVDCGHNTTGANCERCLDTMYGNASMQHCQCK